MKKSLAKLKLRSETIRALGALDLKALTPVQGGEDAAPRAESTGTCPGVDMLI
jgi:hypothetical protein